MVGIEPWPGIPDWRDTDAYAWLRTADNSAFAWEWLRRNPRYRLAAAAHPPRVWRYGNVAVARAHPAAGHWGLHAFAQPDCDFESAQPVWTAASHPFVLAVAAEPAAERLDLFALDAISLPEVVVRESNGAEHLLIMAAPGEIRLDIVSGSLFAGATQLHYRLTGLEGLEAPLLVLRRLIALWRSGRVPAGLAPPAARAERLMMLLRAHDADRGGASQRSIAAALLSREANRPQWRTESPSLRLRAQRLVGAARRMPSDYLKLLGAGR